MCLLYFYIPLSWRLCFHGNFSLLTQNFEVFYIKQEGTIILPRTEDWGNGGILASLKKPVIPTAFLFLFASMPNGSDEINKQQKQWLVRYDDISISDQNYITAVPQCYDNRFTFSSDPVDVLDLNWDGDSCWKMCQLLVVPGMAFEEEITGNCLTPQTY